MGEKLQLLVMEEGGEVRNHFLNYNENGNWDAEVDYFSKAISYKYQLVNDGGTVLDEEFSLHELNFPHNYQEFIIFEAKISSNAPAIILTSRLWLIGAN